MIDRLGRNITYVRVSVTDRCNLRCRYCMPAEGVPYLPHHEILRFEEITQVVRTLARLGLRQVKLTGGEPLCRHDLPVLARMLGDIPGIEEVTLTTNGILLPDQAQALADAGITRVNLSLDTLKPDRYAQITRCGQLDEALDGLHAAQKAGMRVKLNVVPVRGVNDDEILDLVRFGREHDCPVRFIELMPVGLGASRQGLSNAEVLDIIGKAMPGFSPFRGGKLGNGPAVCYGWQDGGVFGLIGAVHNRFCASCNRVRLTADGVLRLCLAQPDGLDLKPYLREGKEGMEQAVERAIYGKPTGHHFSEQDTADRTMNGIGG